MSWCRGCGAEIVWAKTPSGKQIPLNLTPEKRVIVGPTYEPENEDDPGGTLFVLVEQDCAQVVDTFVSHFVTCPVAEQFRMKKAAGT